jgi:hypothetical protein
MVNLRPLSVIMPIQYSSRAYTNILLTHVLIIITHIRIPPEANRNRQLRSTHDMIERSNSQVWCCINPQSIDRYLSIRQNATCRLSERQHRFVLVMHAY